MADQHSADVITTLFLVTRGEREAEGGREGETELEGERGRERREGEKGEGEIDSSKQ